MLVQIRDIGTYVTPRGVAGLILSLHFRSVPNVPVGIRQVPCKLPQMPGVLPQYDCLACSPKFRLFQLWLVAFASVTDATSVTYEQPAPDSLNRVKLPDVYKKFDIPYVNTFDILRKLGI